MSQGTTQIIFLIVIVAAFYFLIIRPQQQRTKQQQDMISSLEPGVEIMTVGGIFATIVSIEDDRILVEVRDGTEFEVAKRAVAQVLGRPHAEEDVESEPEMADTDAPETDSETPAEKDDATDD